MLGLDPGLIMHHLNVSPREKLIEQKLRKTHPHIALLVKEKLKKLLYVGFIRSVAYLEQVSNIVPISKSDKSIKDDFPLPNIDIIVDLTDGHSMFSLMDGFSGYTRRSREDGLHMLVGYFLLECNAI